MLSEKAMEYMWKKRVVVVLRSPIHANEPSEYNGMLYRTSNRVLNNGIKVIILICMNGTSQYHHHQKKPNIYDDTLANCYTLNERVKKSGPVGDSPIRLSVAGREFYHCATQNHNGPKAYLD